MSFSAAPREARNFSSHDIGGFAEVVAARVEEEIGAAVFEVVAMVESGLIILAAAVEVGGFVEDRGFAGGSDEGGLGLLRTSLKALLSTDTIGATCFVLVEVV